MRKPRIMAVPLAQQAFAFVSYEERLEMANVYEQLQAKKLAAVVRKMKKANITIEILKGDVFTKKGEQYLESLNHTFAPQFEIEFSFNREPTNEDRREDVDAFMRCIPGFLDCMLQRTLSQLADVGGADEKIDTLEWVYQGDTQFIDLWVKGRRKSIPLKHIPFSFNWTCAQLGLDPDDIRDGIEAALIESQRIAKRKISTGHLQANRGDALGGAIKFINERSTNECHSNHTTGQAILGL